MIQSHRRTVCIIQARVGSSRLPGKTLRQLGDRTVLNRVLMRVGNCRLTDEIVVATTTRVADDAIEAEANRSGVRVFRGDELDVLARYYETAQAFDATDVIRVTSDCPLIDPQLIDRMVDRYQQSRHSLDYLSNGMPRTFPHGLDTEIFSSRVLGIAFEEAREVAQREHVTPFIYQHPERFSLENFSQSVDQSGHRWTLDEIDDWKFFEALVAELPDPLVSTKEVLQVLQARPEITELNRHVRQKTLADSTMHRDARKAG